MSKRTSVFIIGYSVVLLSLFAVCIYLMSNIAPAMPQYHSLPRNVTEVTESVNKSLRRVMDTPDEMSFTFDSPDKDEEGIFGPFSLIFDIPFKNGTLRPAEVGAVYTWLNNTQNVFPPIVPDEEENRNETKSTVNENMIEEKSSQRRSVSAWSEEDKANKTLFFNILDELGEPTSKIEMITDFNNLTHSGYKVLINATLFAAETKPLTNQSLEKYNFLIVFDKKKKTGTLFFDTRRDGVMSENKDKDLHKNYSSQFNDEYVDQNKTDIISENLTTSTMLTSVIQNKTEQSNENHANDGLFFYVYFENKTATTMLTSLILPKINDTELMNHSTLVNVTAVKLTKTIEKNVTVNENMYGTTFELQT